MPVLPVSAAPFSRPRPLRVGLLTSSLDTAGGGVFEAVVEQAHLLQAAGHHPVAVGAGDPSDTRLGPGVEQVILTIRGPASVAFIPGLEDALLRADLDMLHLHGVWSYPTRAALVWKRRTGRPLVVSAHGMLDPWILSRGRMKKRLARFWYLDAALRNADVCHALTEREAVQYPVGCRTEIIPNAVGGAPDGLGPDRSGHRDFVYIGRIHPKKNLDALVDAWASSGLGADGYRLRIFGWGDASDVERFEARLLAAADPSIAYLGPVFGDAKQQALAAARFVVLPSLSEGLPMAILEAWAAGVPTLMSSACNLDIGFASGAALETGMRVDSIGRALRKAASLTDDQAEAMAAAALALAGNTFSPAAIAARWTALYEGLRASGSA